MAILAGVLAGIERHDMRHLLEIDDLQPDELREILADGHPARTRPRSWSAHGVALLFEKPSARTRNSTEMAVVQLGGHPVVHHAATRSGSDTRETVEDVARTLGCYHALIGARVFDHRTLERMAALSTPFRS